MQCWKNVILEPKINNWDVIFHYIPVLSVKRMFKFPNITSYGHVVYSLGLKSPWRNIWYTIEPICKCYVFRIYKIKVWQAPEVLGFSEIFLHNLEISSSIQIIFKRKFLVIKLNYFTAKKEKKKRKEKWKKKSCHGLHHASSTVMADGMW